MSGGGVSPNEILVVDAVAEHVAKSVRPGIATTIVGKPTFGTIPANSERPALRERLRRELGVADTDFLVTVGFGEVPTERALTQLPQFIELFRTMNVVVAWRFHPKHAELPKLWRDATTSGVRFVDARAIDLTDLNIASDIVIADWGNTDAYKAVICGVPTVTMLFPDDTEARKSRGYLDGIPPIIATDTEWGATSIADTRKLIANIRDFPLWYSWNVRDIRAKPFLSLVEPGADERIADAIEKYFT